MDHFEVHLMVLLRIEDSKVQDGHLVWGFFFSDKIGKVANVILEILNGLSLERVLMYQNSKFTILQAEWSSWILTIHILTQILPVLLTFIALAFWEKNIYLPQLGSLWSELLVFNLQLERWSMNDKMVSKMWVGNVYF